ncbi:hypothetical protein [Nocardiopsis halotolerans]|uniref:hypothetical protein n=1 Tax=Nocardiopsis halotolerans TaxID=124252 RepID=UPI0003477EAD|nr:hypothetical protein [Nocardiopsis halotolerans]
MDKNITQDLLEGYTAYSAPAEIQNETLAGSRLNNVGTSVSLSVSYSVSVSWSVSWT